MPGESKMERNSVSNQPHEMNDQADKMDVEPSATNEAKKIAGSNQGKDIEKR